LDARLQFCKGSLGQLPAVQTPHLTDGDDGAEACKDLDRVAQPMQPQNGRLLRRILVKRHRKHAGEVLKPWQARRRWDNCLLERLLDIAVLADPRFLAASHRLLALRAVHDPPSDSSDLVRGSGASATVSALPAWAVVVAFGRSGPP